MAFGERKLNPLFCYRSITRLTAYGHVTVGGQHETVRIHANLVAGSSIDSSHQRATAPWRRAARKEFPSLWWPAGAIRTPLKHREG